MNLGAQFFQRGAECKVRKPRDENIGSGYGLRHSGTRKASGPGIHNHETANVSPPVPIRSDWDYGFRARDFVAPRNDKRYFRIPDKKSKSQPSSACVTWFWNSHE